MPYVSGASAGGAPTLGSSSLIYRLTVAGSAKASIDTNVDTPDAGTNNWAGGDLLEIYLSGRTDEATTYSAIALTFNNDGGANYEYEIIRANASTPTAVNNSGLTNLTLNSFIGSSPTAGRSSLYYIVVPNFAGTTFNKIANIVGGTTIGTVNNQAEEQTGGWVNSAAITRLKVTPVTAAKNFIIGSQLLIYKRVSS